MDPHRSAGPDLSTLPDVSSWALFLGKFGGFAVYLTLGLFIASFALSFFKDEKSQRARRVAFLTACAGLVLTFVVLATLFVTDQFEFQYIFNHSGKENPLSYKIASVWTAQQGSFLLWAVLSAILGAMTLRKTQVYERAYTATYASFLAVLTGILALDSPFVLLNDVKLPTGRIIMPPGGSGMVPGLQNYWVTIHPPIVFLGFACLTVPFAYGVAALVTGNANDWIKQVRAPVIFGMSVLGLGISLGGLWAYETQGWGGFWGWDPVENVSLVPWLFLVAFAHGIIVQSAKSVWKSANLLMSGLPFLSFAYGTYLTRSGLLDKVSNHSFASMNQGSKVMLLVYVIVAFVGFLGLYFYRAKGLKAEAKEAAPAAGYNRTSFYQLGSLTLCLLGFVISLGISWPVISALRGKEGDRVEPNVYHQAVVWFFVAVMLAMAIAPYVSWKREGLKNILGRFVTMGSLAIGAVGIFLLLPKVSNFGIRIEPGATADLPWKGGTMPLQWLIGFLLAFCAFVAITNLWRAIELFKRSKMGIGSFVAHFGMAVLLSGLIISKGLERTEMTVVREGAPGKALDYRIAFKDFDPDRYYDRTNTVKFTVTDADGKDRVIAPNLYYYQSGDTESAQVWPYIERNWDHDNYFFMSKPEVDVWEGPLMIKPGETKLQNKISVKYLEMTHKGEFGKDGVQFAAKLQISYQTSENSAWQTHDANPTLTFTGGQLVPKLERISPDFMVAITSMNANEKSVGVQMFYAPPLYPIQVFYKPLTCLVWIGTGIFTLGGLLAAFYRRLAKKAPEGDFSAETATIVSKDSNAPLATA